MSEQIRYDRSFLGTPDAVDKFSLLVNGAQGLRERLEKEPNTSVDLPEYLKINNGHVDNYGSIPVKVISHADGLWVIEYDGQKYDHIEGAYYDKNGEIVSVYKSRPDAKKTLLLESPEAVVQTVQRIYAKEIAAVERFMASKVPNAPIAHPYSHGEGLFWSLQDGMLVRPTILNRRLTSVNDLPLHWEEDKVVGASYFRFGSHTWNIEELQEEFADHWWEISTKRTRMGYSAHNVQCYDDFRFAAAITRTYFPVNVYSKTYDAMAALEQKLKAIYHQKLDFKDAMRNSEKGPVQQAKASLEQMISEVRGIAQTLTRAQRYPELRILGEDLLTRLDRLVEEIESVTS